MRGGGARTAFDISHVVETVGVGLMERLGNGFEIIAVRCAGELSTIQDAENARERRAGRHPRRRLESRAAIGNVERRYDACATISQIPGRKDTAAGRSVGDDRMRDLAFVEIRRAGLSESLQGFCKSTQRQ